MNIKKIMLIWGISISTILSACTTMQTLEKNQAINPSHDSKASSDYAKFMSNEYLNMVLAMIQGDSTKRLSDDYRACVKKDYPAMQEYTEQFLQNYFGQDMMKLLNENSHLEKQIAKATGTEKAKLQQQFEANRKILFEADFENKQQQLVGILLDKNFAKSQNQESAFYQFHEFANQRLKACVMDK